MPNFKEDILKALDGDEIIAMRIFNIPPLYAGEDDEDHDRKTVFDEIPLETLLGPEGLDYLDYEYCKDSGIQDCHDIYIWTHDFVYYIHEYDGSTRIAFVPRNPF